MTESGSGRSYFRGWKGIPHDLCFHGNPHAVVYVDDVKNFPLETIGPKFENHERFPNRINTEFVRVIDRKTAEMRVWERGSGETLACTRACAVAVSCVLNGLTDPEVTVKLLGGDLFIQWDRDKNRVYMTDLLRRCLKASGTRYLRVVETASIKYRIQNIWKNR